jgi:hypothetical protein
MQTSLPPRQQYPQNTPTATTAPHQVAAIPPYDFKATLEGLASPATLQRTFGYLGQATQNLVGPDPFGTLKSAVRQDALSKINIPGWVRLLATSERPVADIYPGKYSR